MKDGQNKDTGRSRLVCESPTTRRAGMKYLLGAAAAAAGSVLTLKKAHAGYGRCSVSGCPCPGFMGNANLCGNCGHNYGMHW